MTNLDIGLEVMYTKIETAFTAVSRALLLAVAAVVDQQRDRSDKRISDQDIWSGILRIQRNFWP